MSHIRPLSIASEKESKEWEPTHYAHGECIASAAHGTRGTDRSDNTMDPPSHASHGLGPARLDLPPPSIAPSHPVPGGGSTRIYIRVTIHSAAQTATESPGRDGATAPLPAAMQVPANEYLYTALPTVMFSLKHVVGLDQLKATLVALLLQVALLTNAVSTTEVLVHVVKL